MSDDSEEREPRWLRWLKLVSLIVVPAVVLGVLFLFGPYFLEEWANGRYGGRGSAFLAIDTKWFMATRFWLGVVLGVGLGGGYVLRCIVRGVDP